MCVCVCMYISIYIYICVCVYIYFLMFYIYIYFIQFWYVFLFNYWFAYLFIYIVFHILNVFDSLLNAVYWACTNNGTCFIVLIFYSAGNYHLFIILFKYKIFKWLLKMNYLINFNCSYIFIYLNYLYTINCLLYLKCIQCSSLSKNP